MKFKTVISIASIALLLLSSATFAEDSSDTQVRVIEIPEVPEVTAVVPAATTVIPKAVEVQTVYPTIRPNKQINPNLRPNRENIEIDVNRKFEHKRNTHIIFSKRTPPNKVSMVLNEENIEVGDIKNSRVSLYLRGPYMEPETVVKKLEDADYKILTQKALDKKKKLISIVFTCSALESMGDRPNRGFAASLRILVDGINNQISITNPLYMSRAFMQDDYEKAIPQAALKILRKTFADLKDSEDILKFNLLPKYVFMTGMPAYMDMPIVGKGDHETMLDKLKKSKKVLFIQELSAKRAVIGVNVSKRTGKFIKKAGTQNAALLPYPVLLENGEAKIMDPKYYIAVMYPLLKMGTFMKISTVPGAINNDVKKIFK
ncbi:MAG: hypothetical protein U9N52_05280 [Campylobacterota bacterium]|nr:hypothetical protein [Campylobacterota bacterium]